MTDAEILQSRYDHAHLRLDIVEQVKRGTPTRWSYPITYIPATRKEMWARVRDYSDGLTRLVICARR